MTMLTPLRGIAAAALLVFGVQHADAEQTYEQPPAHNGSSYSTESYILTADDFVLTSGLSLGRLEWWGGYDFHLPPFPDDNFTIRIFADVGGRPGTLVASFAAGNEVNRIETGDVVSPADPSTLRPAYPEFRYSYDLPTRVALAANTRYWISITNFPQYYSWVWELSSSTENLGSQRDAYGGGWWPQDGNVAFRLSDTSSTGAGAPFPSFLYSVGQPTLSTFDVDPGAGTATPVNTMSFPEWPLRAIATAPAGPFLYLVGGWPESSVAGFVVDPSTGSLRLMPGSPFPLTGEVPAAAVVDGSGRFLYVANNGSSDLSAFRIDAGTGHLTPIPSQPFPMLEGFRSLVADPSGDFVYTVTGTLLLWRVDPATGALSPRFPPPDELGPLATAVAVHPTGRFVYTADETSAEVFGYAVDRGTGALTALPGAPFPIGGPSTAITIDPTGRFLFAAQRDGNITVSSVDPQTGSLTPGPSASTRSFQSLFVDPSGYLLFAASVGTPGQDFGAIWAYRIDHATGALTPLDGSPFAANSPGPFAAIRKGPARNQPPNADAGADTSIECASHSGSLVRLDGSASVDPEDGALTFEWRDGTEAVIGATAVLELTVPPGQHAFSLTVTDPDGLTASDTVVVTVVDTTAPTIAVNLSPDVLWPPDGRLEPITAGITTGDMCEANPSVVLVSITDSEPGRAEDVQEATTGTDDRHFALRASRSGSDDGRLYTIRYEVRDAAGNMATATAQVSVPHDQQ